MLRTSRKQRVWIGAVAGGAALAALVYQANTAPEESALPGANSGRSAAFGVERMAGSSDSTSLRSRASTERLPVVQPQQASRPAHAPVMGRDEPFALADPEPPPGARQLGARAYREALARNEPGPAQAAFRKTVDAFLEHNRQLAREQAEAEGLSIEEVGELTQLGFVVQHTQRWGEVEDMLGEPVDANTRQNAEALMHDLNAEFKTDMRRLVQAGAPEAERWALIRDTRQRYLDTYFDLTGMQEEQLDDLLAGDWLREGSPAELPPPEQRAPRSGNEPEPSVDPPSRPAEAPSGEDGRR